MGDAAGQRDFLQVGGTVFQGDLFSYLSARHVVLEGKNVVADDLAAILDGYFGGEILGIQEAFAVGRIAYTVVAVPKVPIQLFL